MVLPRSVMLVSIKRAGEKFDQLWKCCGKTYQNGKLRLEKIADTKTETYSNVTSIRWIAFTCFICMSQHCCTKSGSPGRSAQMCNASKIPKSREKCHQVCILKKIKIYHNCQTNFFHASHTVTPSLWNIEFDQNAVTSHLELRLVLNHKQPVLVTWLWLRTAICKAEREKSKILLERSGI